LPKGRLQGIALFDLHARRAAVFVPSRLSPVLNLCRRKILAALHPVEAGHDPVMSREQCQFQPRIGLPLPSLESLVRPAAVSSADLHVRAIISRPGRMLN